MINLNNNQNKINSELFNNLVNLLVQELLKIQSKKMTDYQIIFNIFNQFQFIETDWSVKELIDSTYYIDQFKNEFLYSHFLKRSDYEKLDKDKLTSLAIEIVTGLFAKKDRS